MTFHPQAGARWRKVLAAALVAATGLASGSALAGPTLDRITQRGNIKVGVGTTPGFRPTTRFAAEFIGLANIYPGEALGNEVRIANGPVLKSAGTASGAVDVIFRPEQVRVSQERPADAENVFSSTVNESYFLGNIEDLILTAEGIDIRTQLSPASRRAPGSKLWISIPPEGIILLPRGEQMEEAA